MDNPFIYGEEVSGEAFTDREEEARELLRDLKRGQNVIIYSPRRYGKTSLIKKVLGVLKKQGLITVYIDLYKATSKQKLVDIYAKAVAEQTESRLRKGIEFIKKVLPRLLPKIVIRSARLPEVEFEYDHRRSISPLLPDLLESINHLALRKKKNAVVVFDEFQEITNFDDDEIEKEMRSHFQSHRRVAYVFLGSKQHSMKKLFLDKNRPFYHSGRHFQLGKIEESKFTDFIVGNFKRAGIQAEKIVLDDLLGRTECHPYYTQLFCNVLWDYCLERNKKKVLPEDIIIVLDMVLRREAHAYIEIWESFKGKSRLLLEALVQSGPVKIFSSEFIAENHLGAPSSMQKAVDKLEERGIIERQNGSYQIADIFFKAWLMKNIL